MAQFDLIIDGERVSTGRYFQVLDPATEQIAGKCAIAGEGELNRAVAAASEAFKSWRTRPNEERKAAVRAMADVLKANAEELAQLLTKEQGKPLNGMGSRWELGAAETWARHTAELDLPVEVLQSDEGGRVELHRKPLGVVGSITPWNFPIMIGIWHIAPAIRTGNTVVVKPSPNTPLSTLRMVELLNQVLPRGVLNVVAGQDDLGGFMTAHPDIQKIVFTGSCATGKKVMRSASGTLKRLTLELGGNDAGIVLPDADPRKIVEGLFWGAFINNGQTCAALKRLYVPEALYEDVCQSLVDYAQNVPVGVGTDEKSMLGPIQNKIQLEKVASLVENARSWGARILCGGAPMEREGFFYPVTIIADVADGQPIVDEEQFGPALPVIRYSTVEEAVERANASENGLGGSVWTSDVEAAGSIAQRLECGSVWVNNHGAVKPNAPFGGVKSSGIGVEFDREGLIEYTSIQVIHQ